MQDPSLFAQVQHQQPQVQPFPEQEHLKCPRCDSGNTKFCYYNNYNLSQPRHFCKSCRRYWTKGGTLRNIPVGGGSRKNAKRTSSSASSSPTSSAKRPASSAPPPSDSRSNDGDGMPPKGDADGFEGGQFGDFTGASGGLSFSSLLGSAEGHFSNLLDPGSGQNTDPDGNAADGFLGGWSGGSNELPDLSMYTPGSSSFL